jgi:protein N-terminal methyltransferase
VVEPIAKFTEKLAARPDVSVANVGLEEWVPEDHIAYNVIWNQWCLGHLTDDQLVAYLRRCQAALAPEGFIVVKENQSSSGADVFDDVDSSVTRYAGASSSDIPRHADFSHRTDDKFREIFKQAGLTLIKTEPQHGFPKTIMPVRMYALR